MHWIFGACVCLWRWSNTWANMSRLKIPKKETRKVIGRYKEKGARNQWKTSFKAAFNIDGLWCRTMLFQNKTIQKKKPAVDKVSVLYHIIDVLSVIYWPTVFKLKINRKLLRPDLSTKVKKKQQKSSPAHWTFSNKLFQKCQFIKFEHVDWFCKHKVHEHIVYFPLDRIHSEMKWPIMHNKCQVSIKCASTYLLLRLNEFSIRNGKQNASTSSIHPFYSLYNGVWF